MNANKTPFQEYFASLPWGGKARLARSAGITNQYLNAIAKGEKRIGIETAARLMAADERITLAMLRPDLFE